MIPHTVADALGIIVFPVVPNVPVVGVLVVSVVPVVLNLIYKP